MKLHKEFRVSVRRTYMFYNFAKGDWEGPFPREFGKMKKEKWEQLCVDCIVNKGPLEDPLLEGNLSSTASTWPLDEGLVGSGDFGLRESHDLQVAQQTNRRPADLPTCRPADLPTRRPLSWTNYITSIV